MAVRVYQNGTHTFRYSDYAISLPRKVVAHLHSLLEEWQKVFPAEETFVYKQYGVPSLWVRFDGVLSANGTEFLTYEIQDGAAGMGYCGIASDDFKCMRDHFAKEKWLPFVSVRGDFARYHDDRLWLPTMTLQQALDSGSMVAPRSHLQKLEPAKRQLLIRRSVIPVDTHNDKKYGLAFGLWEEVSWEGTQHGDALPWHDSFTLKPLRGYGSRDIHMWGVKSSSSRSQIKGTLKTFKTMCLQSFIPPMTLDIDGVKYHAILRPYFAYDPHKKTWVPMHGVWSGRPAPNLRIHGASDAIHGPLYMESE